MQATEILKTEHRSIRRQMTEIACSAEAGRKDRFLVFKWELELHDAVETSVFYPAISLHPHTSRLAGMDVEARRVVAKAMKSLESMPSNVTDWLPYFRAIKGILLRHIEDEESDALEIIGQALTEDELNALGDRMAQERRRLMVWERAPVL